MPTRKTKSSPRIGGCAPNIRSLLTIIAPRHPERGPRHRRNGQSRRPSAGAAFARRTAEADIDVFIADTLGELGLIYRLAPIVFMGGSLASHGGQNPIEAIRLGAADLHGPHVWNFAEIYAALDPTHGAELVADEEALTTALPAGWRSRRRARPSSPMPQRRPSSKLGGALERTLAALEPYLMQLRLEQRAIIK